MSFHPPLPSHPVFHRGLNHLPFPLTQLFFCVCRCSHFSSPLHKHTALTVFPTSASFIQYPFLSLQRYTCSKYFLLSSEQGSQPPNWRHPSFCRDPRKGTLLTAERGWSGSSTSCYSDRSRLCAVRRWWAKKAGYWQLQYLGGGWSSCRSRKDHFCYFSSLYSTTYFYPVASSVLAIGQDRASPSVIYSSETPCIQAWHSHCMSCHPEQHQTSFPGEAHLCGKLSTQNMWTMCTKSILCIQAIPAAPWKSLPKLKQWMGFLQVKYSEVFVCILLL